MISVLHAEPPMTLREEIGQMIVVGFHGKHVSDPEVQRLAAQIRAGHVGGVLLFSYNLGSVSETRALISFLQSQAIRPLLIAVDQEGGAVARIKTKRFPSAKKMSQKTVGEARVLYTEMGRMVSDYGINLVLGPVVDLDHDPPSPAIGVFSRSYGFSTETVLDYAIAFIEGMHASGLLTAIKHFPGHGSAQGDTHLGLVDTTDVWSSRELGPYLALPTADMVMVSHIVNRTLDPSGRPASLSYPMVTNLLRHQVGYRGVVITDDLQMGAIQSLYVLDTVVSEAVLAGNDMLLFGNNTAIISASQLPVDLSETLVTMIEKMVKQGKISRSQITISATRILNLKSRLLRE
jgi:beta-N-acetylhexosaminidase